MIKRDYSEALKAESEMEINSDAFGFNKSISIEGSTCEYHNKYQNYERNQGNMKMDFHSKFSDNSDQNAATTLENMKNFIHWIYDNYLFI